MAKKYEIYLSPEEFYAIEDDVKECLGAFTVIPCEGMFKYTMKPTVVLIYIAQTQEHEKRFMRLYEIMKLHLNVVHYVENDCKLVIDYMEKE